MLDAPHELRDEEFYKHIEELPNGYGCIITGRFGNNYYKLENISPSNIHKLNNDRSRFTVVCWQKEELFPHFTKHLELNVFKVDTPEANLFHLGWIKWQNILWRVASVPVNYAECIYRSASAVGLEVVDAIPYCGKMSAITCTVFYHRNLKDADLEVFPLNSRRTFGMLPRIPEDHIQVAMQITTKAPPPPKDTLIDELLRRHK